MQRLRNNETAFWQNSYVQIWVRRSPNAWRVAYRAQNPVSNAEYDKAKSQGLLGKAKGFVLPGVHIDISDLEWQEFVPEVDGDSVGVFPVLPENSVVVRTEMPIMLGPGRTLSLYAAIPMWMSVRVIDATAAEKRTRGGYANLGAALVDVPVLTLSQTWFGGPMTGRLCFRSDKTLSHTPDIDIDPLAYARCPLRIRNSGKVAVSIGSIAIPTDQMKLYRTVGSAGSVAFWSNPVSATYSAAEELHLGVVDRRPGIDMPLEPWMPPRTSHADHLFQRGLILLREISNS